MESQPHAFKLKSALENTSSSYKNITQYAFAYETGVLLESDIKIMIKNDLNL